MVGMVARKNSDLISLFKLTETNRAGRGGGGHLILLILRLVVDRRGPLELQLLLLLFIERGYRCVMISSELCDWNLVDLFLSSSLTTISEILSRTVIPC